MILEFKEFKLKQDKIDRFTTTNSFIVVGEEFIKEYGDCYKVIEIDDRGLGFFADLKIDEFTMTKLKSNFEEHGSVFNIFEFDIPKERLTLDIVETINRLNQTN